MKSCAAPPSPPLLPFSTSQLETPICLHNGPCTPFFHSPSLPPSIPPFILQTAAGKRGEVQFAGMVAGNQREEKSENREAGRGARCARLKAPAPSSSILWFPSGNLPPHSLPDSFYFIFFPSPVTLLLLRPSISPSSMFLFTSQRVSQRRVCVQTCGCSRLESRG